MPTSKFLEQLKIILEEKIHVIGFAMNNLPTFEPGHGIAVSITNRMDKRQSTRSLQQRIQPKRHRCVLLVILSF